MRYNPDTERGILIEDIAAQCRQAILGSTPTPSHDRVWDCQNGNWIELEPDSEPSFEEQLEVEATLNLWNARYRLQQLQPGSIPASTVASLRRDLADIAGELQRLS